MMKFSRKTDFAKVVFILTSIFSSAIIIFVTGIFVGNYKTFPYSTIRNIKKSSEDVYDRVRMSIEAKPLHYLQPARFEGEGVVTNVVPGNREELIFLSGFFEDSTEMRLIQRDGTIVARWPVLYSELFPNPVHLVSRPATDWNVDLHGALILSDGSVVFNFEYGGLVKLGRCGDIVWTLPLRTHHSVEQTDDGAYWVPNQRFIARGKESRFPPYKAPFKEDTLLKVSDDGKVLAEVSVPGIIYDNGLEAILTSTGEGFRAGKAWDIELVHLNKIDVLTSDIANDFPMFEAGDLALSLRQLNMVMVVDPDSGIIKWWRIGPWLRQHDPEFSSGGTIVVFNNNIYTTAFGATQDVSHLSIPRISNIIEIDPVSGEHAVIYGDKKEQVMLSVIRGKQELTSYGGLLVTEFEGGRVFETDSAGNIIWEYINRYNAEEVAEITEARVYSKSYFDVSNWSCEGRAE